eukprot:6747872-Heterocapsa_arctica.AAC.1
MDWSMANMKLLKIELKLDRAAPARESQEGEEISENIKRMVMQAETPVERTCAKARARGTDITPDDIKGDCRRD